MISKEEEEKDEEEKKDGEEEEVDFGEEMMNSFASQGGSERRGTFVGTVNYLCPEMI